jgi:hypothetical protein
VHEIDLAQAVVGGIDHIQYEKRGNDDICQADQYKRKQKLGAQRIYFKHLFSFYFIIFMDKYQPFFFRNGLEKKN